MIIHREVCFLILAVALGSVSDFHYPTNCTCQEEHYLGIIEINCLMKNNSSFLVEISRPDSEIIISCINSPDWSDFHLDVTDLNISSQIVSFQRCDLRSNNNLREIMQKLCVTDVKKSFQSTKHFSSSLDEIHIDDYENLINPILSSNNVSYVDEDQLIDLTALSFNNTNLNLVTGFFNYTPGLKQLELSNNSLRSIELGTFDVLKNLTGLDLSENHITELQSGIFDELVAIEILYLHENNIVKLPEDIFAKLENLKTLQLSKNNYTDLPRNLLQNNAKLNLVVLNDNKRNMTTLPNEFFANLTELKLLDLGANGFVTLPEDLLWGCTSLTNITLEQNYLQTLPEHIFRDLKELIELCLNSNDLETLPEHIFRNLKKLKELYLNSNDLETLPDHIFSNTKQLIKLDLSKNRITSISDHLFNKLYDLEDLNMEENRLMTISSHAFKTLYRLKSANFSNNYLKLYVDPYEILFGEFINLSPFWYSLSLEELYLANNNISEIFLDWNEMLHKLRKLDLKYNNISYITTTDMFFNSNIQVDLTHNRIQHIVFNNFEEFRYLTKSHSEILVNNNPIHCDCQLYDLLRYIEGRMHPTIQNYIHIEPGKLSCQSPKELKNVRVTDLRSASLTCVSNYTACPEMCKCLERPENKAFIFNCSQRNLTSVPNVIKKINNSFRFELDFSGNRLTRMPNLKAMKLESVKNLTLSHNSITEISLDGLSSTIQVLELHNNNVSRIHPDVLEFLKNSTNLTRLTLHENPWECDCDAEEFQSFIRNTTIIATIPDLINIKCVGTNISVSETKDFCAVNTTMIIGVSITISLMGSLICFFGLLYYKYQRQIKVWLFAHHWCLWFVTEEELDKEKLYDAFVSYSHKDQDFVENELVSKLENGSTPFKLCLHYRDWLAGEWIPANIASSVENSRRTIVVLSPNFLESVWGRMEFRAAHSQALSEGRARVILILYGDVGPTDNLDPELKAYINMNTYIKWGDPWFWDRLKYALPHQPKLAGHSIAENKIFENHEMCIQANEDKKERVYKFPLARCSEPELTQET